MPKIVETIITTTNADGQIHIAPLGLIEEGAGWVIAPFKPSRTLDNLRANPFAVASHVDDVRVFAGCITGRRDWPTVPAKTIEGAALKNAVAHWELQVESVTEDELRPRFLTRLIHEENHKPWGGYNRAQAAVIECAVLTSRLKMLPAEKIDAELEYLKIAISKTAGPKENEAWGWLMEKIEAWRAGKKE